MKLVYVVGARPNFVKMAPVVHELRKRLPDAQHVIAHTGQHYDREMSQIFVNELDLPEPDHFLAVGSGGHGLQTGRALERLENVFERERPDAVLVGGDVNSTLAGALAAAKLEIPVGHVESGLRSFDRSMPEEINRVLVDQISRWCFTHSPEAEENLRNEGVASDRIHFVGNTMIDTLVRLRPRIEASDVLDRLSLEPHGYALVTLHRPNLVDEPEFETVLAELEGLATSLPIVFPVHPRTRKRLSRPAGAIRLLDPVGYVEFLALELNAAFVITDSGGVQEETTFLRVPCFTLRDTTERPVTIDHGTNRLLGRAPSSLADVPALAASTPLPLAAPALWEGRAASRLADVLVTSLAEGRAAPSAASAAP
jgi:UDP-N-acetylglucosamine 2-epimerase (non-hydrolysing)